MFNFNRNKSIDKTLTSNNIPQLQRQNCLVIQITLITITSW